MHVRYMPEAATVPSLTMLTLTVSDEWLARNTHTHTHTQLFAWSILNFFSKIVSDFDNKKKLQKEKKKKKQKCTNKYTKNIVNNNRKNAHTCIHVYSHNTNEPEVNFVNCPHV